MRWFGITGSKCRQVLAWMGIPALVFIASCDDSSVDSENGEPPPAIQPHLVPAEFATIQNAIDAAVDGDTVLVADGIYGGEGNRDVDFSGKDICLLSENGPLATIIECGGEEEESHAGLVIILGENMATVDGFTIRAGYSNHGAAIRLRSSSPVIKNCILSDNIATVSGGAVHCKGGTPTFVNCTIVNNTAPAGGGLLLLAGASPVLDNCIIASSTEGSAIYSVDGSSIPALTCSNIHGNVGGDWVEGIADQAGVSGNLSSDPLFCGEGAGNFQLRSGSPCLPGGNNCGVLIGAVGQGCQ